MPVRKYWRHMLGIDIALYLSAEPRNVKVDFINHVCDTMTDGEVLEMVNSKRKLLTEFEKFKNK